MKRISLLIVSIFAGVSTLCAKYSEQIFTSEELTTLGKKTKQIERSIESILSFKPAQKRPTEIEVPLLRALVLSNTLSLDTTPTRNTFLTNFLLSNINSFKSLINYLTMVEKTEATDFLIQFKKANNRDLNTLLIMEIEQCNTALASLEGTYDKDEQDVIKLVTLERTQLLLLQECLNTSSLEPQSAQDCIRLLQEDSVQKATLLRKLTSFLILAAVPAAAYVRVNHYDYLADLATNTYQATSQFILEKTGVNIGEAISNIPTREAAMAMVQALPGIVTNFGYKEAVQNAFNAALEGNPYAIGKLAGVGIATAGVGYGAYRGAKATYRGTKSLYNKMRPKKESTPPAPENPGTPTEK